jgi:hypothetical protein
VRRTRRGGDLESRAGFEQRSRRVRRAFYGALRENNILYSTPYCDLNLPAALSCRSKRSPKIASGTMQCGGKGKKRGSSRDLDAGSKKGGSS